MTPTTPAHVVQVGDVITSDTPLPEWRAVLDLPTGAAVRDRDGDMWTKTRRRHEPWEQWPGSSPLRLADIVTDFPGFGPLTVVSIHPVRVVADSHPDGREDIIVFGPPEIADARKFLPRAVTGWESTHAAFFVRRRGEYITMGEHDPDPGERPGVRFLAVTRTTTHQENTL